MYQIAACALVAFLWGVTNPLIKRGTKGIDRIKGTSTLSQICLEIDFLVTNSEYMAPFLLNQCGSVLFIHLLQVSPISLAVPITNSLTFLFTEITGKLLGERSASLGTYAGMVLILAGTVCCVLDKTYPIDVASIF